MFRYVRTAFTNTNHLTTNIIYREVELCGTRSANLVYRDTTYGHCVDLHSLNYWNNQSAESTDGLGLHIGGSRKLSSLSKHDVFEQLLQTLNGERIQNYQAM